MAPCARSAAKNAAGGNGARDAALLRREQFTPDARAEAFRELASYFQSLVTIPAEILEQITPEQLVRNVVEVLSEDQVGSPGFRPVSLLHHRTCGFPHPAVEPSESRYRKIRWHEEAVTTQRPNLQPCVHGRSIGHELGASARAHRLEQFGMKLPIVVAHAPDRRHNAIAARSISGCVVESIPPAGK